MLLNEENNIQGSKLRPATCEIDFTIHCSGIPIRLIYSFSTFAKFSEKLTFLTPDMHTLVCVLGGRKC